jgi:signal transduction histidine kinase/streptogramin lyase
MDGSGTWIPLELPIASFPPGAGALVDRHGDCWIGTFTGLIRKTPERVIAYSVRHGLPMGVIRAIHEDRGGTIWIGSSLGGVAALRPDTIGSFTIPDWLPPDQPTWVAAAPGDVIYAGSADGSMYELGDDHVRRLSGPDPELAFPAAPLPGPNGDWWGISRHRVVRFPGPGLDPRRRETFALPGPEALLVPRSSLAPDPAGLFWMTLQDGTTWRFDPRRAGPPIFERRMPATSEPFVPALIHADGTMWGGRMTLLGRLAPSGQVTPIEMDRFATQPRFLYTDRGGRLWVALRFGGLLRIDHPWAATPVVSRRYTVSDGLASDAVWSIVEDPDRQLYLATYRGLDQLDPATGRIRHLRSADGLAGDVVTNCTFDARARLWCASGRGVSWIDTARVWRSEPPPAVYITRLRVAGDDIPVGETGTVHVAPIRVAASKNELQIEFVGLRLGASHQLQYQYRLIGADDRWSALGPDRSVNYSGRQPGQYRFEVRAVDQDGQLSGEVATVDLEILAPFYRRTWFLLLVISAPAAVVFWLQRQRLRHIMAIERVRRQVATDVHDELGSGLSQIAILGEVVKRQASPEIRPIVDQVTDLARTLRASMGDVIWAVDPRRDRLGDLVARMRAVAGALEADGVAVTFAAPAPDLERIELPPDRRRHLLLVFKEAITNITRHAHATSIHVRLDVRGRTLALTIADNGVGFDQARMTSGQGLGNLQRRADLLRGSLAIESVPGSGTTIRLQAPMA